MSQRKAEAILAGEADSKLICMAEIIGAHGLRGMVKLKVFSDNPAGLADIASLCDAARKRSFTVTDIAQHGSIWLATLDGVTSREDAEKLRGVKLHITRDTLPETGEGEFYHADLIGMAARHVNGADMGRVINVANFGAGDLLEIQPPKGNSFYIPFNDDCVPNVDMAAQAVTLDPPEGLLD